MIEKHIYQCEVCGKEFNDEEDCRKHEMEHMASFIKNAVVMMDNDGEVLPLDDICAAIDKCYAIYVGCNEAAEMLWELFEDEGYTTPIENIRTPVLYPAFFIYDQDDYRWLYFNDLEEEYNRLFELKTTAENILLH